MTAPVQSERERIARELQIAIVGKGTCWGMTHPDRANELLAAADWIIARQQEREGPLVRCLEMVSRGHEYSEARESCSCHKCEAWRVLARYRALDAPPQRSLAEVAADIVAERSRAVGGGLALNDLLDELAAALARADWKE